MAAAVWTACTKQFAIEADAPFGAEATTESPGEIRGFSIATSWISTNVL